MATITTILLILFYKILAIKRALSKFFWLKYTLVYCQKKGVKLPKTNQPKFYGHTILEISHSAEVEFDVGLIVRSGIEQTIDNSACSKIVVTKDAKLKIGKYSGISNTVIYCKECITIGDYVNIGAGCMLFDTNFHSTIWQERINRDTDCRNATNAPISIGNHVFIGTRCIICKGIKNGHRSMIAAGSVVICNIPDDELWGGNPARFIKKISKTEFQL